MDSQDAGTGAPLPPAAPAVVEESQTPIVDGLLDSVQQYFDGKRFNETREKVSSELHSLAREFDALQARLVAEIEQVATETRAAVSQEVAHIKAKHPETLAQANAQISQLTQELTSTLEKFLKDLGAPIAKSEPKTDSK